MARRFDRGEFRTPEQTDAGFLRADAYVTRAGVFEYRGADGALRRELRHPDDVFAPESLATLGMAPITLGHPAGLVTAQNARGLSVGHVGDTPAREDAFVRTPVLVTDADAVKAVLDGTHRETSCGYECDVEDGAGAWEGQPYDSRQKNIRYNHVALVPKGRAGPEVRVRLDSGDMEMTMPNDTKDAVAKDFAARMVPHHEMAIAMAKKLLDTGVEDPVLTPLAKRIIEAQAAEIEVLRKWLADRGLEPAARMDSMAKVQITSTAKRDATGGNVSLKKFRKDAMTIEIEEADVPALEALLGKFEAAVASAKQQAADAEKKAMEMTTSAQSEKAKADAALAELATVKADLAKANDPTRLDGLVRGRVALEAKARPILGDAVKLDGQSDRKVKELVLEKITPGTKFDAATDTYIDGRFDMALELRAANALGGVREAANGGRTGDVKVDAADPEAARLRLLSSIGVTK